MNQCLAIADLGYQKPTNIAIKSQQTLLPKANKHCYQKPTNIATKSQQTLLPKANKHLSGIRCDVECRIAYQ
jgi:hypothetical protein